MISGADATAVADEARPGLGPRWWTVNSTTFTFASGIRESANLRKFLREEAPALEGDKVSAMGHGEDLTDHRSQKLNLYWLLPSALHLGFVNELLVRGSARAMAAKHQAVVEAVEKNSGEGMDSEIPRNGHLQVRGLGCCGCQRGLDQMAKT